MSWNSSHGTHHRTGAWSHFQAPENSFVHSFRIQSSFVVVILFVIQHLNLWPKLALISLCSLGYRDYRSVSPYSTLELFPKEMLVFNTEQRWPHFCHMLVRGLFFNSWCQEAFSTWQVTAGPAGFKSPSLWLDTSLTFSKIKNVIHIPFSSLHWCDLWYSDQNRIGDKCL
jgi:hypothetical protein